MGVKATIITIFSFFFPVKYINVGNFKNPIVSKYKLEIYQPCICTYWDISLFYKIAVYIQVGKKCMDIDFVVGVYEGQCKKGVYF